MMNRHSDTVVKDLVLVGGGHSHVTVLKRFGMKPMPGVRVTLVCRDVHTPYSGMLPGLVAGHYDFDEAHIDLGPLSRFAGARFVHDEVTGIDLEGRRLHFRDRPSIPYDVVSINIGSTPGVRGLDRGGDEDVVPVKPISRFLQRWNQLVERVTEAGGARVCVVGAGAGGVEMTLAMQHGLESRGATREKLSFHVVGASPEILPTHNASVRRRYLRILRERGVSVHMGKRVTSVLDGVVELDGGESIECDEVLWVTQASAPKWLGESGLATVDSGFVAVGDTLESASHPGVFAAGDVATMVNHPREKAGVFAVRQGPPLEANLRRALRGESLEPFEPQKKFLSLISTGDQYAVASRGDWSIEGRWVWRWKDRIDRRFMEKFSTFPKMSEEAGQAYESGLVSEEVLKELSTVAMRCAGCGAKVGATVLSRVIAGLETVQRDDVLIGLDAPDDAAALSVPEGKALVQTIDSFRAIVDDPYVFGKIAANHALGDVFAMGAEAQSAMAVVVVPYAPEAKTEALLEQLLKGAVEVLNDAGAALVGGHTSEGAEVSLGFALSGLIDRDKILRKGGMQAGDHLILTKPVGTGTLFAADMRLKAKGRWIEGALASMLQSNRRGAEILMSAGATACTDVTGFGLLGHLVEMTKASEVDAELSLATIPILEGARETVAAGIVSSLQEQNLRLRRAVDDLERASRHEIYPLLYDPQTAGGLLASVPADRSKAIIDELRAEGYTRAEVIGSVAERSDGAPIRLR
ncbi:MAG: selenide, water dikinase SelD [Planctomycetota bacterium]